ncbi:MAG: sigma-70 family RNA polymerase sigma factor [Planctomycetes bacterium]|nr:sigma-70 family RNA polymerase sigma factor [Planctomycetota bacterium]
MDQPPLEVETLLAQRGWLRALAIRLVYDENRADDLVQQVWLQALERPPRREGSVRGWLRAVLRSRWRDQQRSDAARGARERASFEERAAPATAEIAARVEAQQIVARAVLELDEPLRAIILLHFFEDLPVREVARRLDLPYETVRHRLGRALDALRLRLNEERGEGESRSIALLLIDHGAGGPPPAAAGTGGRLRGRPGWTAVGAAAVLLGTAALVVALAPSHEVVESRGRPTRETAAVARTPPTTSSAAQAGSTSTATHPTPVSATARARAEVRVRTVGGEPVTGATVEAWTLPASADGSSLRVATAKTDGEGRARIDDLAPGRFTIVARAAGHPLASAQDRRLDLADAPQRIDLFVGTGYALAGRVVDEDGRAVAGAVLVAEPPRPTWDRSRGALRVETSADAEGRYAFDVLTPGETTLWAALPGGVPVPMATVLVPAVTTFDLKLRRGGTLRGRVTDEATGAPVSGADVRVQGWAATDVLLGHAVTGADGHFSIDALLECVVRQVVSEKDGYASDALADRAASPDAVFSLPRGATVTRDLLLRRGGDLSGCVTGPGGPVAGASVSVTFGNRLGQWAIRNTTTDAAGRYTVLHVAAGQAFVRVEARGLKEAVLADPAIKTSLSLEPFRANVTEGGDTTFDVAMIEDDDPAASPAGRVRVVVVDARGETPRGAWVEVVPTAGAAAGFARERTLVGPDGALDVALLPATAPTFRVRAAGPDLAETWSAEFAFASLSGAAPVHLRLEAGTSLAGEVRRQGTGAPVPGAQLQVSAPREDGGFAQRPFGWSAPVVAISDIDGRFVIPHIRAGTYEVAAAAEGSIVSVRMIKVPTTDAIVFELEAALEIAGRVAFADGTGLPGVGVVAAPETRANAPNLAARPTDATTAQDGSFVIRGVAPGRYRLRVGPPSDRSLSFVQPVTEPIEAGTHDAHVLVERALQIAGRVLDAGGRPARGVLVSLEAPGARVAPVGTDVEGAFAFVGLRAGAYAVSARTVMPGGSASIARSEDVAAGTLGLELVLGAALSIEGVVIDAEGHEVPGAAVRATPVRDPSSAESRGYLPVSSGGRFAVHGLAPGTYEIDVGNLRDRLRPLVVRGARQFQAGATDVRLEVRAALTVSGRLFDEHGAALAGRVIEFIPEDAQWPRRRVTTSATGSFTCDGLGYGRHRAELVEGTGESATRVQLGACDAGASGVEWSVR